MDLRSATADDADDVAAVHHAAFGCGRQAALVAAVEPARTRPAWSVTAEVDGRVVGHVLVSYADLALAAGGLRQVPLLAPMAVLPSYQGRGIGGALVREAIARVAAEGEPVVLLEGDAGFYLRFGFRPAGALGILPPRPEIPPAEFLAIRLGNADLAGRAIYPPPFAEEGEPAPRLAARRRELAAELASRTAPPPPGSTVGFGKRIGDGTTEAVERISTTAVARSLAASLAEVDRALAKYVDGSYGRCDRCGEAIPAARLAAKPAAATCVGCAA